MATYRELVKQSLIEGLKRANYNIKRFQPAPIKVGLFMDRSEIENATRAAQGIANIINIRAEKGENMSRENLERIVDIESAVRDFGVQRLLIRISMGQGKNASKFVQAARDDIAILENYPEAYVQIYKRSLKELIGEE